MINNNQKATLNYHEYVDYKGQEIEVRGEVFPEPIRSNKEVELKTKISLLNDDGVLWGTGEIFYKEASKEQLIDIVKAVKNNIEKYK